MAETIPHWIDGKPQDGRSGRSASVYDPGANANRVRQRGKRYYPNKRAVIGPNRPLLAGIGRGRLRALVVDELKYMHRRYRVWYVG